jgi:hypothetical protein
MSIENNALSFESSEMAKQKAINAIVQESTGAENTLKNSLFSKEAKLVTLGVLTAFAVEAQTPTPTDIAKNNPPKVVTYQPKAPAKDTNTVIMKVVPEKKDSLLNIKPDPEVLLKLVDI